MHKSFGQRLAELRKDRKLTQLELSTAVGIPTQNYRLYENDRISPKAYTLLRLCCVMGLDPLIFSQCTFKGNEESPIAGLNQSKTFLRRANGEMSLKGINKLNKRKLQRLAGVRKIRKIRATRAL